MSDIHRIPFENETGIGLLIVDGNPDGVFAAPTGMMAVDRVTGSIYSKTPATLTSWKNTIGPRVLFATFDGVPDTDIDVGHFGKILPLGVAGTLTTVRLAADVVTTGTFAIWKDILANGDPTIADAIAGSPFALTAEEFHTYSGLSIAVAATDVWFIKVITLSLGVRQLQVQLVIE